MRSLYERRLGLILGQPDNEWRLGPYRLLRQLGCGSFASVWLADEVHKGTSIRKVAIKLFEVDSTGDRGVGQEQVIIDEAHRLCRVEHPNVVRFYSLHWHPVNQEYSLVGLVMEHIEGQSLMDLLSKRRKLSIKETLAIGAAVAAALTAVHFAGVVHRDICPDNIIVTRDTHKLIDFGIALPLRSDPEEITLTPFSHGRVLGGYLDPVCVSDPSTPPTPANDLYALGAILFICATGQIPAAGTDRIDVKILVGQKRPPALRTRSPHAPEEFAHIVDELLDPDPHKRPALTDVMMAIKRLRRQQQAEEEVEG